MQAPEELDPNQLRDMRDKLNRFRATLADASVTPPQPAVIQASTKPVVVTPPTPKPKPAPLEPVVANPQPNPPSASGPGINRYALFVGGAIVIGVVALAINNFSKSPNR